SVAELQLCRGNVFLPLKWHVPGCQPGVHHRAVCPTQKRCGAYSNYATLALGSALALFLYPHAITAILSASSPHSSALQSASSSANGRSAVGQMTVKSRG